MMRLKHHLCLVKSKRISVVSTSLRLLENGTVQHVLFVPPNRSVDLETCPLLNTRTGKLESPPRSDMYTGFPNMAINVIMITELISGGLWLMMIIETWVINQESQTSYIHTNSLRHI